MAVFGQFFITVAAFFAVYEQSIPPVIPRMYYHALAPVETVVCEYAFLPTLEDFCISLMAARLLTTPSFPPMSTIISRQSALSNGTYSSQSSSIMDLILHPSVAGTTDLILHPRVTMITDLILHPSVTSTRDLIVHPLFTRETCPVPPVLSPSSSSTWKQIFSFILVTSFMTWLSVVGPFILISVCLYHVDRLCGFLLPCRIFKESHLSSSCDAEESEQRDVEDLLDPVAGACEDLICDEDEYFTSPSFISTAGEPELESPETILIAETALESSDVVAEEEPAVELLPVNDERVSIFILISGLGFELF
jgi:hypothetical protein